MIHETVVDGHHRGALSGRLREVQAAGLAIRIVAQIYLDRSRPGIDLHRHAYRDSVGDAGKRVVARGYSDLAARHPADGFDHALLRIVEPVFRVGLQHIPSDVRAQLKKGLFPDAHRAQGREVIAPPLLRHPDAQATQAHNVVDIPIVLLNPDGMENQRSLLIDVARVAHIGRRQRIAAVGLVSLGKDC
jgi:hypothetical protein